MTTLVNAFFFSSSFTSPASSGNGHFWQSSPDQREGDRLLPLHEQERQASGEGKCFQLIHLLSDCYLQQPPQSCNVVYELCLSASNEKQERGILRQSVTSPSLLLIHKTKSAASHRVSVAIIWVHMGLHFMVEEIDKRCHFCMTVLQTSLR